MYYGTVERGKINGNSKTLRQVETNVVVAEVDIKGRPGKDDKQPDQRGRNAGQKASKGTGPDKKVTPPPRYLPSAALRGGELQDTSLAVQPYDFVQHSQIREKKPKKRIETSTLTLRRAESAVVLSN